MNHSKNIASNYLSKLLAMVRSGELAASPGNVSEVTVTHDDGCSIWLGRACNCDPDFKIETKK